MTGHPDTIRGTHRPIHRRALHRYVLAILAALFLIASCGGDPEETDDANVAPDNRDSNSSVVSCAELSCAAEGRVCEAGDGDEDARCGTCLAGFVEEGGRCESATCASRAECPEDEIGEWSSCDYQHSCSQTAQRTRAVVNWSCNVQSMCSGTASDEVDTEGCVRVTEGEPCTNGSCVDGSCQLHTPPELTTLAVSQITPTSAVLNAELTATGGDQITDHGFCWGTSPNELNCEGLGELEVASAFSMTIEELDPLQTYYVEAYANAAVENSRGNQVNFQTPRICEGNFVITDNLVTFANDYGAHACTEGDNDCDGACPEGTCLDFDPFPAAGCGAVTGHVFVAWNENLEDLSPLEGLTEIGGTLRISDNTGAFSLQGLQSLMSVNDAILISNNADLERVDSLVSLSSVGAGGGEVTFSVGPRLEIIDNPSLMSIVDLDNLTELQGSLMLENSPALVDLEGFATLTKIGGMLRIVRAEELSSLEGLRSLTQVGHHFALQSLPALTSLTGLDGLQEIDGELYIAINTGLEDISALSGVSTVGGGLTIWANRVLPSLAGLDGITDVAGSLMILNNDLAESLEPLANLQTVGGNRFWINGNLAIPRCEAEALLAAVDHQGDDVNLDDNDDEGTCD